MNVTMVGLNHRTAPVDVRERLAIPPHAVPDALDRLRQGFGMEEAAILSTCNRTELYAAAPGGEAAPRLIEFLSQHSGQPSTAFRARLYAATGREAAAHLLRVTAGLDSMILGESEITAQVKRAYQLAQASRAAGPRLHRLFQRALHSAKLIRSRTQLVSGHASLGSVVAALAARQFGAGLSDCRVLLWGAGKAAEASARHLVDAGVGQLWIVNRTDAKAQDLAGICRGRWLSWEQARAHLAHADIAIVCTQAPHYVIDADDLAGVRPLRGARPLVLIDLAVPRNIDPAVARQPGVSLANIDDLQAIAQATLAQRQQAVGACEAIIQQQVASLWQDGHGTGVKEVGACVTAGV